MKDIPGSVAAVSDDWLVGILEEQGRYERGSIRRIDRQPMGEGIGQPSASLSCGQRDPQNISALLE